MILITDSEISFLKNKTDDYITSYLVSCIDEINDNSSILYFSYNYSKKVLLNKYKSLNRDNITIIDDLNLNFNNVEKYIIKYQPKYAFIDYLKLTKTKRYMYVSGMKIKELKDKVDEYENRYNVKFIIMVNYNDGTNII